MPFQVTMVTVVLFGLYVYVLLGSLGLLMQSPTRRQSITLVVAFWTAFVLLPTLVGGLLSAFG